MDKIKNNAKVSEMSTIKSKYEKNNKIFFIITSIK
jgi:hypothetical protein